MKKALLFAVLCLEISVCFSQQRQRFKMLSEQTLDYYNQAKQCWNETDESCIPFYKKMVESAKKNKECVPCAEIELAKGYYYELDIDASIHHAKNVLKDAKSQKDSLKWELEQDAYNLLAGNYSHKGNTDLAIKSLLESGKRIDKLGNKEQAAILKGNIGINYVNTRNYEKGIQYSKTAIKELEKLGILKNTAAFAGNIAGAYVDTDVKDSALVWAKKTIKLAKEQNDIASETAGYYLTGAVYEKINTDSALYYVNKSIPLAIKTRNNLFLATAYNIKGNIYAEKDDYVNAKKYYTQSIEIYRSIGNPAGLYAPLRTLGFEAYRFADYQTASKYMSEYITYQDSVVSEDNRKLVHELNTKYETEKKEKLLAEKELLIEQQNHQKRQIIIGSIALVILLLGSFIFYKRNQKIKQHQILQQKEKEILVAFIEGEERERKRISHELHDGVATMLGVLKMNMEVIPHLQEDKREEQVQKVLKIIKNTHADVRHIAHNLLPITLEKEGLIKATQHFAEEINQTGVLAIKVIDNTKATIDLPYQKQLMLFRIIQELINNIIKHSQANNTEISFSQDNDNLQIIVTDNGIGFNKDNTQENQGIKSINQRLASISGKSIFESDLDNGTRVLIELKI